MGEIAKSDVPMLGYTVPYAVSNTLLTLWGLVIVLLMSALLVAMLVALVTMTLAESRVVQSSAKARLARAHALKGLREHEH